MLRRILLIGVFLSGMLPAIATSIAAADDAPEPVVLVPNDTGTSFDFETEHIQGTIRLDDAYHGVTRLVDKRTGRQVIDARYSALNLFKLMSVNQAMAQPRHMERTIRASEHWVEVEWAPTDAHHARLTARYEVSAPDAIDVTVTVQSQGTYRGYELFMSSYFDKEMIPYLYLQSRALEPELVLPTVSDVFRGTVLVFPRDAHSARPCLDGRWDRKERDTPTVQMCPLRRYSYCLAFLADPDKQVAVALMADPGDCYAISTRYYAEDDADRLASYSAFDLSLFGDDLLPNVQRSVTVRLVVIPLDEDMSRPLDRYRSFIAPKSAAVQ